MCWFRTNFEGGRAEVFIHGIGWTKYSAKKFAATFTAEEIPDLVKPFTDQQFIDYANKHGVECAQEFLDSCDYYKPRAAQEILNPPKNIPSTADQLWFKATFNTEPMNILDGYLWSFGNRFSIDVLKFERLLTKFGYDPKSNTSMNDFISSKFGVEACNKIRTTFLSPS